MATDVPALLRTLAEVEPLAVPSGEPGVGYLDDEGQSRLCVPVLSVYLDLRPAATSGRPELRPARIFLRERMREIEKTFLPRGMAYESLREDAERIETYLDTSVAPDVAVIAIFRAHNTTYLRRFRRPSRSPMRSPRARSQTSSSSLAS